MMKIPDSTTVAEVVAAILELKEEASRYEPIGLEMRGQQIGTLATCDVLLTLLEDVPLRHELPKVQPIPLGVMHVIHGGAA